MWPVCVVCGQVEIERGRGGRFLVQAYKVKWLIAYRVRRSSWCSRCRRRRARRTSPWRRCSSCSCCPRRGRRSRTPARRCASYSCWRCRRRESSPARRRRKGSCGAATATGCASATCRSTACCCGAAACATMRRSCAASSMTRASTRCLG